MIKRFFRALWNILKSPWAMALLVALLVVLLIWFVGPLVAIADYTILKSVTARLVATVIVVFCWGLFVTLYYARSRKKLLADPEKAKAHEEKIISKERFQEEIDHIRDRMQQALAIVTKSNFYGPQSRSRYALPWYMVIGSSHSGKTSLLLNSGLKFPLNEQADRHLYQVRTTERFDALYSNEAVFIDTPGTYTESIEESVPNRLWSYLLRKLFRSRPAHPLSGIIVCVSMREIMDADSTKREHLARTLRTRLSEALKQLHAFVPVYLVFTKSDAVPGFAQFFGLLSRHEREQIFGSLASENSMEPGVVRTEIKELLQNLNAQIISKLHQERDALSRGGMFRFPQELASMGERLEDFVAETFGPSRYHKPVIFRGFFFTSAAVPNDALGRAARDGELLYQTGFQRSGRADYTRAFFTLKLFQECIIPEARLARADKDRVWPTRLRRYGIQAAAVALFLLGTVFMGISFTNNYSRLDTVQGEYSAFVAEQKKRLQVTQPKEVLPELGHLAGTTTEFQPATDKFLEYGLGLYQGNKVDKAANKAYLGTLNSRFLPILRAHAARKILENLENVIELKPALRSYIMLCQPRHIEDQFLTAWLGRQWSAMYHGQGDVQAELHASMDYLVEHGIVPIEPDAALLEQARRALMKVPLAELVYERMKEEAIEGGKPAFTFRAAIGESPFAGDDYAIPYLWTLAGYDEYLITRCPDIIRETTEESWIYGEKNAVLSMLDVNKVHKDVRAMYFRDYTQYWTQALQELHVPEAASLPEAHKTAELMTAGVSPVVMVLRELRKNTEFVLEAQAGNKKVEDALSFELQRKARQQLSRRVGARLAGALSAEAVKSAQDFRAKAFEDSQRDAKEVRAVFQPYSSMLDTEGNAGPALKASNDAMAAVRDYFGKLLTSDDTGQRVLSALLEIADEKDLVLRNVERAAQRLYTPSRIWYTGVASSGLKHMLRIGATRIDSVYQKNVIGVYNQALRHKYPFTTHAEEDANLEDFTAFFRANGTLDSFYDTYLRPFIGASGQLRSIMGRTMPISANAVTQLSRANRVQRAFFLSGNELGISFLLETHALDASLKQVTLNSGGKSVTYFHGPVAGSSFTWPEAAGTSATSTLEFTDLNGISSKRSARGDWSLFKLFREGNIKSGKGSNTCLLEVQQKSKWVQFLIQFRNGANPFDPTVCSFVLPSRLL